MHKSVIVLSLFFFLVKATPAPDRFDHYSQYYDPSNSALSFKEKANVEKQETPPADRFGFLSPYFNYDKEVSNPTFSFEKQNYVKTQQEEKDKKVMTPFSTHPPFMWDKFIQGLKQGLNCSNNSNNNQSLETNEPAEAHLKNKNSTNLSPISSEESTDEIVETPTDDDSTDDLKNQEETKLPETGPTNSCNNLSEEEETELPEANPTNSYNNLSEEEEAELPEADPTNSPNNLSEEEETDLPEADPTNLSNNLSEKEEADPTISSDNLSEEEETELPIADPTNSSGNLNKEEQSELPEANPIDSFNNSGVYLSDPSSNTLDETSKAIDKSTESKEKLESPEVDPTNLPSAFSSGSDDAKETTKTPVASVVPLDEVKLVSPEISETTTAGSETSKKDNESEESSKSPETTNSDKPPEESPAIVTDYFPNENVSKEIANIYDLHNADPNYDNSKKILGSSKNIWKEIYGKELSNVSILISSIDEDDKKADHITIDFDGETPRIKFVKEVGEIRKPCLCPLSDEH